MYPLLHGVDAVVSDDVDNEFVAYDRSSLFRFAGLRAIFRLDSVYWFIHRVFSLD
jgi:hypothetical protein